MKYLELLQEKHPYFNIQKLEEAELLDTIPTKTNNPTLKIDLNGKEYYIHSKYDPIKESQTLLHDFQIGEKDIVVVLGLGLGYHVFEIKKNNPDCQILVIELNNDIYNTFFYHQLEKVVKYDDIVFLSVDDISSLSEYMSFFINKRKKDKPRLCIFKHPGSVNVNKEQYLNIEQLLFQISSNYYSNILTEDKLLDLWGNNSVKNKKYFKDSIPLKELLNKFKNKKMAIVCAGSTLEKNIDFLKNEKDLIIVAVDTCLRYLLKNKIYPDFVLSLDAGYENLGDFKYLDIPENVKLIYDIITFPKIIEYFKDKYVAYTLKMFINFYTKEWGDYRESYIQDIVDEFEDFGGLQSGGSVATNAFDFALYTGADPIYFVGLDLCYINYKTHCRGTYKEKYLLNRTNKFFNYDTLNFITVVTRKNIKEIKNNDIIHYDYVLRKYQIWFDNAFKLMKNKNIKVLK